VPTALPTNPPQPTTTAIPTPTARPTIPIKYPSGWPRWIFWRWWWG
jgi:hypothetical protein